MAIVNVLSIQPRPGASRAYEELVAGFAKQAADKEDEFRWETHQTVLGETPAYHFVSWSDDFAGLQARGMAPELFARVLGAKEAARFADRAGELSMGAQNLVSLERPDLSYAPDPRDRDAHPFAMVTLLRSRPGGQEALEELLRKIAEAIPKTDDPARIASHQVLVGDLRAMWTVRPLRSLADLDVQRTPQQLLDQAFGPAEGGLVWRGAMEAIEEARRSITAYRPDLSNPG